MPSVTSGNQARYNWWRRRLETATQNSITLPATAGDGGVRTPGFVGYPARPEMVAGTVQGRELRMYDFTQEQYDSLVKLTSALCTVFPRSECDYPRGADGKLVTTKLGDAELAQYRGLLGHYHIAENKIDPGPAMQWDLVVEGARARVRSASGAN